MQNKLSGSIIELKNHTHLHFSRLRSCTKFGFEALFKEQNKEKFYCVLGLSKQLLHLNNLKDHIDQTMSKYLTLNSSIVAPIKQQIHDGDMLYIISMATERSLGELVSKRSGLTEYEAIFFVMQLYEIMNYLKSRNCYIQKLNLANIQLKQQLKISVSYSLHFNIEGHNPLIKKLPFRNECQDKNNCPDFTRNKAVEIQKLNSWILGCFLYELLENRSPFPHQNSNQNFDHKSHLLSFAQNNSLSCQDFIRGLLRVQPSERLKFSTLLVHPYIKLFPTIPHTLPDTIFSCPPSLQYKKQYINFQKSLQKQLSGQYQQPIEKGKEEQQTLKLITQKCMQPVKLDLTDSKVYVQQYIDVSHKIGYGYQMNTGSIGFVFNDQTQILYSNSNHKSINYVDEHGIVTESALDKLPEQEYFKRKLYILEAYSKSIKKYKPHSTQKLNVMVLRYARTNNAGLFMLSNESTQVIFNDKSSFLFWRGNVYFQLKANEKMQRYLPDYQDYDLTVKKQYCQTAMRKIFHLSETGNSQPKAPDGMPLIHQYF